MFFFVFLWFLYSFLKCFFGVCQVVLGCFEFHSFSWRPFVATEPLTGSNAPEATAEASQKREGGRRVATFERPWKRKEWES